MSENSSDVNEAAKVVELMRKERFAMLASKDTDGSLQSRPMTVQTIEDDGTTWFFGYDNGPLAEQINGDNQVNLAFSASSRWVSLSGTAELVSDKTTIDEHWNEANDAFYPEGKETPNLVLIKVESDSAEYWDQPGGNAGALFNFVKAKVTGDTYDGGTSGSVDL